MECRLLEPEDTRNLYETFKSAFSNNEVKLQPSLEEFEHRLYRKLMVDGDLSAGYFDGTEMIGFILHASKVFQGIPTAYNGGTGVLPGFRNQRIAEELYAYLIPKIQSKFLARILLEVVEVNEYAIKLYEKIGFNFKRRFKCYKQVQKMNYLSRGWDIEKGTIDDIDIHFNDFDPSFLDSEENLKLGFEDILVAKKEGSVKGYIVFQAHLGRISQISTAKDVRQQGIGRSLLFAAQKMSAKPLNIMNIPDDQLGMDIFLRRSGFENQINQFEMELII